MNKKKILIVDDDSNIAELISLYLTKEFFQCEIAPDGETALQLFETFSPDILLLDIMLPGMDGYDVCREIRKKSNTPIIMLSAKEKYLTKCWAWNWALMITSSNHLIPKKWLPG